MTTMGRLDQAGLPLDLHVLGAFAVLRGGRPIALPPSRKTRALLAYLAVAEQSHTRERLCRMFWNTPDDPRGALRWSLSKIRQIVNVDGREVVATDRNAVTLQHPWIALDLREIQQASQQDLAACDLCRLEDIASLFRGRFLEDLSLPRCPEFEAWRVAKVSEVDLLKARILRVLVDRLAAEPSRALPYAHALQAMDSGNSVVAEEVKTLADLAHGQAARTAPAASALIGDGRKHVTVLSLEIVSPLHAFASVGPEVVSRKMDPLFESTQGIVERHGGIISASGDAGVTAVFGASDAGENHAADACRVALAVKSAIELQSAGNVRVRAGLDSGEVVIRFRRRGATERIEMTGAAVRTAARLVNSLRRGLLAVTDRTHVAAATVMDMGPLCRSEFPGFHRDQQVYELLNERAGG